MLSVFCRITESSHAYESFGAEICPQCKCNELWNSDFSKNYAICYETECARNYLLDPDAASLSYLDAAYYSNTNDYAAVRIKVSDSASSRFEYVTCWSFESGQFKATSYYSYSVRCPEFEDLCYAKNPWMCSGHGMVNTQSSAAENACFCDHGYVGCDCTLRNTAANRGDAALIASTCVAVEDDAFGTMPEIAAGIAVESPMEWVAANRDDLGMVNVTMSIDGGYSFEAVVRTLRLWVAVNVKVHEDSVWIDSYQKLETVPAVLGTHGDLAEDNLYGISIVYFDPLNANQIEPASLIEEFGYLFGAETIGGSAFVLYDIYDIKQPQAAAQSDGPWSEWMNVVVVVSVGVVLLFCLLFRSRKVSAV